MHRAALTVFAACAACAGPAATGGGAPDLALPVFAADDPRVDTAGFVGETTRISHEHAGVRYTLMAFAVGDTLTLGAMVRGAFRGDVWWQLGEHRVELAFDSEGALEVSALHAIGDEIQPDLPARGARFRGTAWINVELPLAAAPDGAPLRLTFVPREGDQVTLPAGASGYRVSRVTR